MTIAYVSTCFCHPILSQYNISNDNDNGDGGRDDHDDAI